MSRSRVLKWVLGAVLVGTAGVAAWFALRPPKPVVTPPDTPDIRFTDTTDSADIRFRHISGASGKKLLPETMGAGVAVIDFDGDGKPDLFFVNSRPWPGEANTNGGRATPALYRNRGDGTFEDVTAACGLDVEIYGMGVAVGDFDNDGWSDLFVTAVGGNRLFRNVEGKKFEDVTDRAGLRGKAQWPNELAEVFAKRAEPIPFPASAAWLDYDGDGRLDLFVCYYVAWSPAYDLGVAAVLPGGKRAYVPPQQFAGVQCELHRNVDGTRFENVSASAGIHVSESDGPDRAPRAVGKALGVVVGDFDGDGWPDIVVANDTVRNFFFHNESGPNGTRVFKENGLIAGIAYAEGRPRGGMGIDTGEIMPDTQGVVIANFTHEPNSLFRLMRAGSVQFEEIGSEVGLVGVSSAPMKFGAVLADFDNDGRLDLFTANGHLEPDIALSQPGQSHRQPGQLFWNSGQRKKLFVPVPGDLFPPMVGRGCAYFDYNGDGKLDLVVTDNNGPVRLFRNDTPSPNTWLRLKLVGNGTTTNRDAIGAEVTIEAGGVVQHRYVNPARGYLSQSELVLTVGIGAAKSVEKVTVRWPGKSAGTETWTNLEPGKTHTLKQGEAK